MENRCGVHIDQDEYCKEGVEGMLNTKRLGKIKTEKYDWTYDLQTRSMMTLIKVILRDAWVARVGKRQTLCFG